MAFVFFNPNPKNKRVGDCSVRALCKALNMTWDEAFLSMAVVSMTEYDMPSANYIWGQVLHKYGFDRMVIPSLCPVCKTVKEFAEENQEGTYVLACENDHVVTVENGNYFDTWDSGDSVLLFYYKTSKE